MITLQDVIKYLQDRPHMVITEKNPYQADRLMMMLDNEKLAALEQEFNEHPNGIELPNFIWLMKCAISHSPDDKYDLVNGLIKLFFDIDINGDGHMEWAEFTQYIIDAVIGNKDAQLYDARFERDREMTEIEVLDRAYSRKSKRYDALQEHDKSYHKTLIKNILYSQINDNVICLEQNSSILKFYSSDCQERNFQLSPPMDEGKIFILHFHVTDIYIAAVTSDRQFIFWENSYSQRIVKSFKYEVLQTGIWFFPVHNIWITAGADYNIRGWNMKFNDRDQPGEMTKFLSAHMGPITEIVELVSPRMIASASHDGKIKLWDLQDQKLITELKSPQPNTRIVLGLSYNRDYGSNLISYGLEIFINVWCPEVSITRAYIGKLEGHMTLVVACRFIPNSPNCVSIDDRTNIRIWDIRSMSSVQILPNDQPSVVTDICIITRSDRFVYSGKRLNYFHNAALSNTKQKGPNEEIYPIAVEFNVYYNAFVVLTKIDIRIYDAMSGKLKKVVNELFDDKMQLDISALCFGGRQRKFFVSDNAGLIRQYNMKNGEFLKKVNQHNEIEKSEFANKLANIKKRDTLDISSMIFLHEEKLLISASLDSTIRIYDENDPEESSLIKVFCGGHQNFEILCMAYSLHFTMLATGSGNGQISLWDFETSKLCGVLMGQHSELVALDFADPYPILVSAQGVHLNIWGLRQRVLLLRINSTHTFTSLVVFSDITQAPQRIEPLPEFKTPMVEQNKKKGTNIQEEIDQFTKDFQIYDAEKNINKRRLFVYASDMKGYMHVINATEFIQRKGIKEEDKQRKNQSYQLKRKDLVDASKSVETFLVQDEKSYQQPQICNLSAVLLRQWVAHTLQIVKINKIRDPISFISSSMDKHFKIWSIKGDLWADINLTKYGEYNYWKFPYDWVGQKLKDIESVFDQLKKIEKENLTEEDRERIKVRFLMNKYFDKDATEDLNKIIQARFAVPEVQVVTKEKKQIFNFQFFFLRRFQQSQSQKISLINKPIQEELIKLNQKIKDEMLMRKKLEAPEPIDQPKPPQNQGLIQRLMIAFGDQKEQQQQDIIESNIKKKPKVQKRDLPIIKPQSSSGKLSSQFMRNTQFMLTQLKTRPNTESKKYKYVNDIKYQNGESMRVMKVTTYQNFLKFQSASPQLTVDDNEILKMKCQFYKDMNESYKEIDDENEDLMDEEEKLKSRKQKKIVATSNFLNNASKNKHKVLKTKNKIFVI